MTTNTTDFQSINSGTEQGSFCHEH